MTMMFIAWHFVEKDAARDYLDTDFTDDLEEKLKAYKGRMMSVQDQKEYLELKKTKFPWQNSFGQGLCVFLISFLTFNLTFNPLYGLSRAFLLNLGISLAVSIIYSYIESKRPYFGYVFLSNYFMLMFFNTYSIVQEFFPLVIGTFNVPLIFLFPYFWVIKKILNKLGEIYEKRIKETEA